mmetsp:Transcript_7600/g.25041  ORF Transcript_7600/g.25041 Transcript_7600/m.25041 type:complete len:121 (+) Transcript_7600:270-632(+)
MAPSPGGDGGGEKQRGAGGVGGGAGDLPGAKGCGEERQYSGGEPGGTDTPPEGSPGVTAPAKADVTEEASTCGAGPVAATAAAQTPPEGSRGSDGAGGWLGPLVAWPHGGGERDREACRR